MADYMILATIHILVGFELFGLGFIKGAPLADDIEAMMIIGFLLYIAAVILMVLVKGGGLGGNKMALIATMILTLLAGLFILVGVVMWGIDYRNSTNPYTMTLDTTGMVMAFIGGIFLILAVAKGGGSKTGP